MELIETRFLTSVIIYHKSVSLIGGVTEHFTVNELPMQTVQCLSGNTVREFRIHVVTMGMLANDVGNNTRHMTKNSGQQNRL